MLELPLREESLSPQGVDLIRMLQPSIKEEVRAIQELLTIMQTFIDEPIQADSDGNGDFKNAANRVLAVSSRRRKRRLKAELKIAPLSRAIAAASI